jgi:addiction module HigA family antidote
MFEVVDYRRKGWGMKIDGGSIRDGMPPIHPGEGLADDLEAMEMSAEEFDQALAVPCGMIAAVLEERRSIDAELALRLSHYFGTTARLWMDLQVCYDLKVAERKVGPRIFKEVTPRPDMLPRVPEDWEE